MRHIGKALTVAALAALAAPAIAQQPGATGMPGPSLGTPVPAPGAAQAPNSITLPIAGDDGRLMHAIMLCPRAATGSR